MQCKMRMTCNARARFHGCWAPPSHHQEDSVFVNSTLVSTAVISTESSTPGADTSPSRGAQIGSISMVPSPMEPSGSPCRREHLREHRREPLPPTLSREASGVHR
jgi:hypothetical protein